MLTDELRDLYRKYAPDVHRFATYLSGDRSLADDITSETFLRVWSSAEPIRVGTVRAYLFTVARNVYRHEVRRRSRHSELDGSEPVAGPGTHERMEQRQALDLALQALRRLPEADRTAILMRALDKTPYEEIAWTLGVSVTAAKVKVHRARIKLAGMVPREVLS